MGPAGLAQGKKNAARLRATLVFLDESGVLMAPLVRRSWSPCGHTPILRQRTRFRQKVSVIAAVCVSASRDRLSLYFRLHPNTNINRVLVFDFLAHLQHQLQTPMVVILDRFKAHLGELFNECVPPSSAHLAYLPPYAPELNPVEYVWGHLKTNALANNPAFDLDTLSLRTRNAARSVQRKPTLLRGFIRHTGLSLRLT